MQQVIDDFGDLLRRGVATPLSVHDWQMRALAAPFGSP
jgi:hypothetical protein